MTVTKAQAIAELQKRGMMPTKEQAIAELHKRGIDPAASQGSIGKSLAKGARNVAAGLMEIPDLLATPVREALNLGSQAIGSDYRFRPMSENVAHGIDEATQGYTRPETKSDKTTEAVTRSLASLPIGGMMGKAISPFAKGLGTALTGSSAITPSNVAGSAGASALMQEALNENPDDMLAATGAGLAGGIGGGLAAGSRHLLTKGGREGISRVLGEKLGNFTRLRPSAIEDFQGAGISPLLADVSHSRTLKGTTHSLEHIPWAGSAISRAKEAQRKGARELLDVENALSRRQAGALASEGGKGYQKSKEAIHSPMFEKFEADLSKLDDTNIALSKTSAFVEKLTAKNKNGVMEKKFSKTPVGKAINELRQEASIYGGEIPYESLKQTLDTINDQITTHGLVGKVSQGRLKKLADVISHDMEHSLEHKFKQLGGDAYSNWKEAKHLYREYATNDIPNLNEMFKKDKKGAISLFEDLVANNRVSGHKAEMVLSSLPEKDQIDLVTALQKRLRSQADGTFNMARWGTEFKKLDDHTKHILLSPLSKETQKKVNALSHAVDHIKDTLSEANSSKTSYHTGLWSFFGGASTAAGHALVGNFAPAAHFGTLLLMGKLGASALSNPKIVNWAYQGMRSKDLSHYMRHLERLEHMGGIHRSAKSIVQGFINDINATQ